MAVSVLLCAGCAPLAASGDKAAELKLELASGKTKVVTVILGQSAGKVVALCKPPKVYADDDPWLAYKATGGGGYVLFFSHQGPQGRLDPRGGSLYAVAHYPTGSRDDGTFLLPAAMRGKTCGQHITLKVTLGPGKRKVATVALGMSIRDVASLFEPAHDDAEEDHAILYGSADGGRYLLTFSPTGDGAASDSQHGKLSEVMYRPGGQKETYFVLPRAKRGKPLPAEYVTLLGDGQSDTAANKVGAGDARPSHP